MIERYQRQILCPEFGPQGQENVLRSGVLICGCGALGGAVANILARAGVGFLRLIDPDRVQWSNLHRQFLFNEKDAHAENFKVEAAKIALQLANSTIQIETVPVYLTESNADSFVFRPETERLVDVIIDGTDNFTTRFLLNRLAVRHGIPLVTAGVSGTQGQIMTVFPGKTPCLACVLGSETSSDSASSDSKSTMADEKKSLSPPELFPVLSPIVQLISALQAMETLKILSGHPEAVSPDLTSFDLWNNRSQTIHLNSLVRNQKCSVCHLS